MGLLDQLANEALGALANQGGQGSAGGDPAAAAAHPGMMDVLTGLLGGQSGQAGGSSNGLGGLLAMAQQAGLGDVVASWIGTGQNQPISVDQLRDLLGSEQVSAIAQKLGLSPELATQMLSQVLPQAVDHLTPDGQVPHNDLLEQGLALFKSMSAAR